MLHGTLQTQMPKIRNTYTEIAALRKRKQTSTMATSAMRKECASLNLRNVMYSTAGFTAVPTMYDTWECNENNLVTKPAEVVHLSIVFSDNCLGSGLA